MIPKEELYIIVNGNRHQIDLESPSGITLKFISNMFNDLSKFCASYSYTFKIPKSRNNVEKFDLIDDIRHESSVYGKRIKCEYYRDGLMLFNNSYLYVSECSNNTYNAVMTWNVIEWLLKIKEDGLSINDLEKNTSDLTTVVWGSTPSASESQNMEQKQVSGAYRCGRGDAFMTNPPLIPVRYLLNRIATYYGYEDARSILSFLRVFPLTTSDLDYLSGMPSKIWEDGAIPLVNGEWSDRYEEQNRKTFNSMSVLEYADKKRYVIYLQNGEKAMLDVPNMDIISFSSQSGVDDFFDFWEYGGYVSGEEWNYTEERPRSYVGFMPKKSGILYLITALIRIYLISISTSRKFYLIPLRKHKDRLVNMDVYETFYEEKTEKDKDGKDVTVRGDNLYMIELKAKSDESGSFCELNYDPSRGGSDIELEITEENKNAVIWILAADKGVNYIPESQIQFCVSRENSDTSTYLEAYNKVDLFHNLPSIKIIDFLKSLFYIEDCFPVLDKDEKISLENYHTLFDNMVSGNVYDWSNRVLIDNNAKLSFNNSSLAQRNYYKMANESASKNADDLSVYNDPIAFFNTDNESLPESAEIFKFPFASACIKNSKGVDSGYTFPYWIPKKDPEQKVGTNWINAYDASSPTPIIGRINVEGRWYTYSYSTSIGSPTYMQHFHIWEVFGKDYSNTVFAKIFKKPYFVTETLLMDVYMLNSLDFSKPVYLEKHNAYFAIVTIQLNQNGTAKGEFIKLPPISEITRTTKSKPVITMTGSPVIYKKISGNVGAMYEVITHVADSYITNVTVTVDGSVVKSGRANHLNFHFSGESGTHILRAVATAANGTSAETEMSVLIKYAAETVVIEMSGSVTKDAIRTMNGVNTVLAKRGIISFSTKAYNYESISSFKLTCQKFGDIDIDTFAESNTDAVSGIINVDPAYEEGYTKYLIKAIFTDGTGKVVEDSRTVQVYTRLIQQSDKLI